MTFTLPSSVVVIGFAYALLFPLIVGLAMWYIGKQQPDTRLVESTVKGWEAAAKYAEKSADAADRAAMAMSAGMTQHQETVEQLTELACKLKQSDAMERALAGFTNLIAHRDALEHTGAGRVTPPAAVTDGDGEPDDDNTIESRDM